MLIGVTANMILPKLPCKIDKLHIVTSLCCGEGEFELSTKIYAPDQKTVVLKNEKPNKIILKDTNTLATVVQCFINPTFNEKGIYDNVFKAKFYHANTFNFKHKSFYCSTYFALNKYH